MDYDERPDLSLAKRICIASWSQHILVSKVFADSKFFLNVIKDENVFVLTLKVYSHAGSWTRAFWVKARYPSR